MNIRYIPRAGQEWNFQDIDGETWTDREVIQYVERQVAENDPSANWSRMIVSGRSSGNLVVMEKPEFGADFQNKHACETCGRRNVRLYRQQGYSGFFGVYCKRHIPHDMADNAIPLYEDNEGNAWGAWMVELGNVDAVRDWNRWVALPEG